MFFDCSSFGLSLEWPVVYGGFGHVSFWVVLSCWIDGILYFMCVCVL
jgi:hypothetical protein